MRIIISVILGLFITATASAGDFELKSKGFKDHARLPLEYTCEKGSHTPDLSWDNVPSNTQSLAITFSSLDTPVGLMYLWVLYNIPADVRAIPEAADPLPEGTLVGKNSMGNASYYRPCPVDDRVHHFVITLYALDAVLDLPDETKADKVLVQINKHVIKEAKLNAVFSH